MTRSPRSRPWLGGVVGAVAVGLMLTGCSTGPNSTGPIGPTQNQQKQDQQPEQPEGDGSTTPASTPTPDPVAVTANPGNGAKSVKVDTLVSVKASNGTLTKVSVAAPVKDRSGKIANVAVDGALNDDKTEWKATDRLEPGVTYTVTSTGTNSEGTATKTTSTFSTQKLSLDEQTFAAITPLSGTYGVGMPIVITFDVPVTDRKAFEKHLLVTATPKQAGTWSWYSSTEVHYRPKTYWKAATRIKVHADVNGLSAGNGVYGQESRTAEFTIGKSIITKVNISSLKAQVVINGKVAKTIPVSAGKKGFTTRSGTKIVNQKLPLTQMRSETIGINEDDPEGYDLKVKYAIRITNSGEFLHAAPWNAANMGVRNSSHGCIGMNTSDAAWLFTTQQIGDPVVVTGTNRNLEKGNGWTDWNVSYSEFSKGSAL